MEDKLTQIEQTLENLIEGGALRVLGSTHPEKKLVSQLIQALKDHIREDFDGSFSAPHLFTLNVPAEFAADIRGNQAFLDRIANTLTIQAAKSGIRLAGNIIITIFPDPDLKQGDFTVKAIWSNNQISETGEIKAIKETGSLGAKPPRAFLIVDGSKIFTIEQDVINIGRLMENNLVINNPQRFKNPCPVYAP